MSNQKIKKLPRGISNFERIRTENYYYVDKSEYIAKMEESDSFLFFVRPRRFGKSLFLSMLSKYYDVNEVDRFDELFGGLWIHENPTDFRGKFLILYLDFSQVSGEVSELKTHFGKHCSEQIDSFLRRYEQYYSDEYIKKIQSENDIADKFNVFNSISNDLGLHRYLIVDEYDNFTNTILSLSGGEDDYRNITHGVGFYRGIFKQFKGNFDRILMMGVSPVTMDDLTSGYNIATNITLEDWFNSALGFSETEVREMIEYYRSCGAITRETDDIIKEIKPWYDNNCFSRKALKSDKVFNSNMVLHYMRSLIQSGESPEEMVDPNIITDYKKLKMLVNIAASAPYRKDVLRQIAEEGKYITKIKSSFPAEYVRDKDNYISLLFYYGMLTISGEEYDDLILSIPNHCVRDRYWEFMRECYAEDGGIIDLSVLRDCFKKMARNGDIKPFIECMAKWYHESTSVRSAIQGERGVQAYLLAHLNLTNFFVVKTERELNHGFADFVLYPNLSRFDYLRHVFVVELKYIPKGQDTPELRTAKLAEAHQQLDKYVVDTEFSTLPQEAEIHKIIVMCAGDEMMFFNA